MNVNVDKTKIVIFQKRGNFHNEDLNPFMVGDREIKVLSEYNDGSVIFSENGIFLNALNEALNSTKTAYSASLALISRLNTKSWKVIETLLQFLVFSVLIYRSTVWSQRYLDKI